MRRVMLWLLAWMAAAPALAQGQPPIRPELPTAEQPVRRVPTTSYTLAISWAPEYCHAARGARADDPECADRRLSRGFTLHGLWPDGDGPNRWPQYCHPVAILTDAQVADALAYTPSRQLLQHEWAKHGSCTGADPVRYFAEEDRLYRGIVPPDLGTLSRRPGLTAADVAAGFAAANPGLPATAVRVNANRQGWLEEVWLCLGLDKRPHACPATAGGVAPDTALKIETAGGAGAAYRQGGYGYGNGGYRPRYRRY